MGKYTCAIRRGVHKNLLKRELDRVQGRAAVSGNPCGAMRRAGGRTETCFAPEHETPLACCFPELLNRVPLSNFGWSISLDATEIESFEYKFQSKLLPKNKQSCSGPYISHEMSSVLAFLCASNFSGESRRLNSRARPKASELRPLWFSLLSTGQIPYRLR